MSANLQSTADGQHRRARPAALGARRALQRDVQGGLPLHCLSTSFPPPSVALPVNFLSSTFHNCRSTSFPPPSATAFHCLFTAFHCLFTSFLQRDDTGVQSGCFVSLVVAPLQAAAEAALTRDMERSRKLGLEDSWREELRDDIKVGAPGGCPELSLPFVAFSLPLVGLSLPFPGLSQPFVGRSLAFAGRNGLPEAGDAKVRAARLEARRAADSGTSSGRVAALRSHSDSNSSVLIHSARIQYAMAEIVKGGDGGDDKSIRVALSAQYTKLLGLIDGKLRLATADGGYTGDDLPHVHEMKAHVSGKIALTMHRLRAGKAGGRVAVAQQSYRDAIREVGDPTTSEAARCDHARIQYDFGRFCDEIYGESRPTAAIPMENPYCSCRLRGVLEQPRCRERTAAIPMDSPY